MKQRCMYGSLTGSLIIIHIILMKQKNILGELFNWGWREKYAKYKEDDNINFSRDIMSRYRNQGRSSFNKNTKTT